MTLQEITTASDGEQGKKVVVAAYGFEGRTLCTNALYYQDILNSDDVRDSDWLVSHFGHSVLWFDLTKHNWPQGR